MKKIIAAFLILFAISMLAKYSHCEENKENQKKPTIDYAQKYYEKMAKEDEEREKNVKEFEPTTPIGKFMGHFVGAFLVVSLVIIFVAWLLIGMFGEEDIWANLLKGCTVIILYFLVNYLIWFILKSAKNKYVDTITATSFIITAILFGGCTYFIYRHHMDSKHGSQIPTWRCSKCNVTNHHNDICWNCNTAKPIVKE